MPWPTKQTVSDDGETLRLETGKVVKVQIMADEPELYYTHFINGKSGKCPGDGCPLCAQGIRRDTKGSLKVKDLSDGKEKALKGTAALFVSIHEVLEICGAGKGFLCAIKAIGEKKDRRYHVTAIPTNPALLAPTTDGEEEPPF